MPKKRHTKPTGTIGLTRVSVVEGGAVAEFEKVDFPGTKDAVELKVARAFLKNAFAEGLISFEVDELAQNPEDDLDFTLHCHDAVNRKLELMEIAPLETHRGDYSQAQSTYRPFEFAESVFGKIAKKSKKYGATSRTQFHLLVYITDWRFIVSQSALTLLRFWTLKIRHNFVGIYLYMPRTGDEGFCELVYPAPWPNWDLFDPSSLKQSTVQNLNPEEWKSTEVVTSRAVQSVGLRAQHVRRIRVARIGVFVSHGESCAGGARCAISGVDTLIPA